MRVHSFSDRDGRWVSVRNYPGVNAPEELGPWHPWRSWSLEPA